MLPPWELKEIIETFATNKRHRKWNYEMNRTLLSLTFG